MRLKVTTYPLLDHLLVTLAVYEDNDTYERLDLQMFEIPYYDLKVKDVQHVLEAIYRQVCETTP